MRLGLRPTVRRRVRRGGCRTASACRILPSVALFHADRRSGVTFGDLVKHSGDHAQRRVPGQLDQPAVQVRRCAGEFASLPGIGDGRHQATQFLARFLGPPRQAAWPQRARLRSWPGVITSASVAPDNSSTSPAGRATISGPGTRIRAPVRAPRRTSTSRSDSNARTASRNVGRLTWKCAIRSGSCGRKSPSLSCPSTIILRSVRATSSDVFGDRTARGVGSGASIGASDCCGVTLTSSSADRTQDLLAQDIT